MKINIRKEIEDDYKTVEILNREAFWNLYNPGCNEHYLVHLMRKHDDFMKEMAFVAEYDNEIVGNIMYTKSYVVDENNNKVETLSFGPLCVHPKVQRKGIGTSLINHTKKIAQEKNIKAIIIHGFPHNYCKHGFKNCIDYNISNPEGKFPFGQLVLELENNFFKGKKWKYFYSTVYDLDMKNFEEYDKQFPIKEKKYQYSQEEFRIATRAYLSK